MKFLKIHDKNVSYKDRQQCMFSHRFFFFGGPRVWTLDLVLAKQVLYYLSHASRCLSISLWKYFHIQKIFKQNNNHQDIYLCGPTLVKILPCM
jgi:hypothetical protein